MNIISHFLFGKDSNIDYSCFGWNMIAGMVNASEAVIILMVVTRTSGIETAGIVSIAFAFGNLLMTLGKFGVRNFQVTDVKGEYSFCDYWALRVVSCSIMTLISFLFISYKFAFQRYTCEKSIVILAVCFIYVIESFEDLYLGWLQAIGRLDIASKIFVIRWGGIIFLFLGFSLLKIDTSTTFISLFMFSLIIETFLLYLLNKRFPFEINKINYRCIFSVVKQCYPLFLVSFLSFLLTNLPKYAIDMFLSDDLQGYFGYISMPVFLIELLNNFVYQPQIVKLSKYWNERRLTALNKKIFLQLGVILAFTLCFGGGAYFFGTSVLSFVFGVDLSGFRIELFVLMIAGGAMALVGYSTAILTIMRKQYIQLMNILIVFLGICKVEYIVSKYNILGICIYFLSIMLCLALLNYGAIFVIETKSKDKLYILY